MSMNSFAPFVLPAGTSTFVVKNITGSLGNPNQPKCVLIFNYPILENGGIRDLMMIEGVSEESIRASLLKGEINRKLRAKEITILASDIDLFQFNQNQANFLYSSGITNGIKVTPSQMLYRWYQNSLLNGVVDSLNLIFTIPTGTFIVDDNYMIVVYLDGIKQLYLKDFFISMSGSAGYDTIIFAIAPKITVLATDNVTADYWVANP